MTTVVIYLFILYTYAKKEHFYKHFKRKLLQTNLSQVKHLPQYTTGQHFTCLYCLLFLHRLSDHRVKDVEMDFSGPSTLSAIKLLTNVSDISSKQMDIIKDLIVSYSRHKTMSVPYEIMLTFIYKEHAAKIY